MATGFNTQTGGGEYRLQFETDNKEYFLLMQELARCCVDHLPIKTNADRIRAMSDEELAKHLNKLTDSYPGVCRELPECRADLEADRDIPLERCEGCWIQYLRQPAEA